MRLKVTSHECTLVVSSLRTAAEVYEDAANAASATACEGDDCGIVNELKAQAVRARNLADRIESGELYEP